VTRGLWDYLQSTEIATRYDNQLAGSAMFVADQQFAEKHFDRPGRLLDLGCGTGRTLLAFARRGFWTLGVDLSEPMLKIAAEKALAAGIKVQLLKANIVELDSLADQSFDYVTCFFSTLGMVIGAAQRRRVIDHVYRLLRPGGKFVLHVHNRWFNVWNSQGRRWLIANWLRSLWGSAETGDRVMPVHQGIAGLTLHLFTRREARRLLRKAGFRLLEIQCLGLDAAGRLSASWWFPGIRSYGYLLAAARSE
jgi:ubiquinone/menaquinone biosynthesis C-methylase UbiE